MRIRRAWHVVDDRLGISRVIMPVIRHRVPPGARWKYVFGSATLFAFAIQVITGIFLAMVYVPSTAGAYDSLKFITHDAVFGM